MTKDKHQQPMEWPDLGDSLPPCTFSSELKAKAEGKVKQRLPEGEASGQALVHRSRNAKGKTTQ